jgi:hypothetical protein
MLSEKSEADRISTANINSRQKKRKLAAASGEFFVFCVLAFGHVEWTLKCACSTATQLKDTAKLTFKRAVVSYSSSNEAGIEASYEPVPRLLPLHSRPGAFIAQIAAMNTAFARGKMVKVSAIAVMGHSIMLIHSGQWKLVSANNADGTTM